MRVQLVGRLPDRADRQDDDLADSLTQRCVCLLDGLKLQKGRPDGRVQQGRIEGPDELAGVGAGRETY
jgi:hypothetical protein